MRQLAEKKPTLERVEVGADDSETARRSFAIWRSGKE